MNKPSAQTSELPAAANSAEGFLGDSAEQQGLDSVTASSALTADLLEQVFRAAGDSLRMAILQVLKNDSFNVFELCSLFDVKQSAMSHHLKILVNSGLLTSRRQGNAIFYRRCIANISAEQLDPRASLINSMFDSVDAAPLDSAIASSLSRIQRLRSEASLNFFSEQSEKFRAQQDLISPIEGYRETLTELLDAALCSSGGVDPRQPLTTKQAIEIGPGEGIYLAELVERFEHVIALDNSESMLDRCRKFARKKRFDNIGFIHGDTRSLIELVGQLERGSSVSARRASCVVANMVLHHNASPWEMFRNVSKLLCEGGIFVVSELVSHEQGWVRDAAGDVWLGFDEEQLHSWGQECGMYCDLSSYTALKNGFRIQMHVYRKK